MNFRKQSPYIKRRPKRSPRWFKIYDPGQVYMQLHQAKGILLDDSPIDPKLSKKLNYELYPETWQLTDDAENGDLRFCLCLCLGKLTITNKDDAYLLEIPYEEKIYLVAIDKKE